MLVLVFSSFVIPYRIAFTIEDSMTWMIINALIDISFALDILVVFNTAFYDENFKIVVCRKRIAIKYLKSWFFIDLFAIIPFDYILNSDTNMN